MTPPAPPPPPISEPPPAPPATTRTSTEDPFPAFAASTANTKELMSTAPLLLNVEVPKVLR